MFVRDEVMLDIGFDEARDRLAKLDSWFLTASDHAYGEGIAGLARIGPLAGAGLSRLAEIASRIWRLRMAEPGSR